MLPSNQWVKEKIKRQIKKYLETNENGNSIYQNLWGDFTGGAVVKNLPVNAGDTGSSLGPGRSHMPWSN